VHYQYFAHIRAGTGGVLKVYVFLGEEDADATGPVDWMNEPGFVGFTGFQTKVDIANAGETEMQMNGVVALTSALEDKVEMGQLIGFDEVAVGAYLQDQLSWRLVGVSWLMVDALSRIPY
jgi:tyrosinase